MGQTLGVIVNKERLYTLGCLSRTLSELDMILSYPSLSLASFREYILVD